MEANVCDINHLDADVLLPPRKRLLAGFKKQSSDGANSDSSSRHSLVASPSSEFSTCLNNRLAPHMNNPNLTPEELMEASRSAAIAAVKAAEAARAAAEEKAAIAVKAMVAAKSALDLVASFSEEEDCNERYLKKNKLKKHVPVKLLYKKLQPIENDKTGEELAHRLHRAMNSFPRISNNSSSSNWKSHNHKMIKSSFTSEITRVSNVGITLEENPPCECNGHVVAGKVDSEESIQEVYTVKADEKASKFDKAGQIEKTDNGETETSHSKEKNWEDTCYPGKKKGRVKLKKLPLSICTFRDGANPKEEVNNRSSPLTDKNVGNPTTDSMSLFSGEPSDDYLMPVEAASIWKCQEFKVRRLSNKIKSCSHNVRISLCGDR